MSPLFPRVLLRFQVQPIPCLLITLEIGKVQIQPNYSMSNGTVQISMSLRPERLERISLPQEPPPIGWWHLRYRPEFILMILWFSSPKPFRVWSPLAPPLL